MRRATCSCRRTSARSVEHLVQPSLVCSHPTLLQDLTDAILRQGTVRVSIVCLAALAGAGCKHGSSMPAASPAPIVAEHTPPRPLADHHLHLASPASVEVLTPTPLPAASSGVPEELERLLAQRELKTGATPQFVSDLYTKDAVIRARRGGGWVGGAINIARALNATGSFRSHMTFAEPQDTSRATLREDLATPRPSSSRYERKAKSGELPWTTSFRTRP